MVKVIDGRIDADLGNVFDLIVDRDFILKAPSGGEDGKRILVRLIQGPLANKRFTLGEGILDGNIKIRLDGQPGAVYYLDMIRFGNVWHVLDFKTGYVET